jgi:hypothetical protein
LRDSLRNISGKSGLAQVLDALDVLMDSFDGYGGEDRVDLPVIGCVAHEPIVIPGLHVNAAALLAFVHVALQLAELRVDVIVQHVAVAELEVDIVRP